MGAHSRRVQHERHARRATTTRWRLQLARADDIDFGAKPDLVAPGTGTVSMAAPGQHLLLTKATSLAGASARRSKPYLSLSGTSMAAPVVAGTVALMLQANPSLTPNLIKAILQYTSQLSPATTRSPGRRLPQHTGAVRLAKFYKHGAVGQRMPMQSVLEPDASSGATTTERRLPQADGNAWGIEHRRGARRNNAGAIEGDNIVWGTAWR